jgi:hypothetical protein
VSVGHIEAGSTGVYSIRVRRCAPRMRMLVESAARLHLAWPVRVHRWLCRLRRACVHAGLADVAYCMERARGAYNHYPVQKDTDVK